MEMVLCSDEHIVTSIWPRKISIRLLLSTIGGDLRVVELHSAAPDGGRPESKHCRHAEKVETETHGGERAW